MNRFIGREEELSLLDRIYAEENTKTCMVYGRRRIGKTSLIEQFTSGKRNLTIQFDIGTEEVNVGVLAQSIRDFIHEDVEIDNLRQAMNLMKKICEEEKTILVFDELPYLTSVSKSAASEIQHLTDWVVRNTDSMVIICGSSISLMQNEVRDPKKPLYGRFAFTIHLMPFTLEETRAFHPSVDDLSLLDTYLILGGVTAYHSMVGNLSFDKMMDRYVLNKYGFLQNDVLYGISVETHNKVTETSAILKSISSGYDTYGTIMNNTGIGDYELQNCLERMMTVGLIRKTDSMIKPKKSKLYVISDPLVSFYYNVIDRNPRILDRQGRSYKDFDQMISTQLGKSFEEYCRNLINSNYPCTDVGRWWGSVPVKVGGKIARENGKVLTEDVDIDVVATIHKGNNRIDLFGECKHSKNPMSMDALGTLVERVESLGNRFNARYALFSTSGFTKELSDYAKANGILLFSLEELTGKAELPSLD